MLGEVTAKTLEDILGTIFERFFVLANNNIITSSNALFYVLLHFVPLLY